MDTIKVGDNVFDPFYKFLGQVVEITSKSQCTIRLFKGNIDREVYGWQGLFDEQKTKDLHVRDGNFFLYVTPYMLVKLKGVKWQKQLKRNKKLLAKQLDQQ